MDSPVLASLCTVEAGQGGYCTKAAVGPCWKALSIGRGEISGRYGKYTVCAAGADHHAHSITRPALPGSTQRHAGLLVGFGLVWLRQAESEGLG